MLFAGTQERVNYSRSLCRVVRASKQVILSPQGNRSDRILNLVIIDLDTPIFHIPRQFIPSCEGIADRLAPGTPGQSSIGFEPCFEPIQYRTRFFLSRAYQPRSDCDLGKRLSGSGHLKDKILSEETSLQHGDGVGAWRFCTQSWAATHSYARCTSPRAYVATP